MAHTSWLWSEFHNGRRNECGLLEYLTRLIQPWQQSPLFRLVRVACETIQSGEYPSRTTGPNPRFPYRGGQGSAS